MRSEKMLCEPYSPGAEARLKRCFLFKNRGGGRHRFNLESSVWGAELLAEKSDYIPISQRRVKGKNKSRKLISL